MIVAVAGPAGSGKSLVSAHLIERHGFREVSFAAPLKRIAKELWGFTDRQLYGPSSARSEPHPTVRMPNGQPLTARVALQVLGSDVARALDPDVWVRAALADIKPGERVAISDVRYKNEVAALKGLGAFFIRRKPLNPVYDPHPTEREMLDVSDSEFDAVLGYEPDVSRLRSTLDALIYCWSEL